MKIDLRIHSVPKFGRSLISAKTEDVFAHTSSYARPFVAVVVDGHGDPEVNATTHVLARYIARQLRDRAELPERELCHVINQDVLKQFAPSKAGAVATRIVVTEDTLTVLSVGDCRLYRFTPDNPCAFEQLTKDHHPDQPEEYRRLFPHISPQNPNSSFFFLPPLGAPKQLVRAFRDERGRKTISGLRVTRSFGDPEMFPLVLCAPEVKTIPLEASRRHLFALCSDGGVAIVEKVFSAVRSRPGILLNELHHLVRCYTSSEPEDDVTIMLIEIVRK